MTEQQPTKRTAAEIEADLERARKELTESVDALAARVDPRRQIAALKAKGKGFASDVKSGKPAALAIVGGTAAAIATVTTLVIVRSKKS